MGSCRGVSVNCPPIVKAPPQYDQSNYSGLHDKDGYAKGKLDVKHTLAKDLKIHWVAHNAL